MRLVTIRPEHAGRHWSVPILTFFTHFSIWVEVHNGPFIYCEAQGKGRAKVRLRKVTQRLFIDCRLWIIVYSNSILSLMLYTRFGDIAECGGGESSGQKMLTISPSVQGVGVL